MAFVQTRLFQSRTLGSMETFVRGLLGAVEKAIEERAIDPAWMGHVMDITWVMMLTNEASDPQLNEGGGEVSPGIDLCKALALCADSKRPSKQAEGCRQVFSLFVRYLERISGEDDEVLPIELAQRKMLEWMMSQAEESDNRVFFYILLDDKEWTRVRVSCAAKFGNRRLASDADPEAIADVPLPARGDFSRAIEMISFSHGSIACLSEAEFGGRYQFRPFCKDSSDYRIDNFITSAVEAELDEKAQKAAALRRLDDEIAGLDEPTEASDPNRLDLPTPPALRAARQQGFDDGNAGYSDDDDNNSSPDMGRDRENTLHQYSDDDDDEDIVSTTSTRKRGKTSTKSKSKRAKKSTADEEKADEGDDRPWQYTLGGPLSGDLEFIMAVLARNPWLTGGTLPSSKHLRIARHLLAVQPQRIITEIAKGANEVSVIPPASSIPDDFPLEDDPFIKASVHRRLAIPVGDGVHIGSMGWKIAEAELAVDRIMTALSAFVSEMAALGDKFTSKKMTDAIGSNIQLKFLFAVTTISAVIPDMCDENVFPDVYTQWFHHQQRYASRMKRTQIKLTQMGVVLGSNYDKDRVAICHGFVDQALRLFGDQLICLRAYLDYLRSSYGTMREYNATIDEESSDKSDRVLTRAQQAGLGLKRVPGALLLASDLSRGASGGSIVPVVCGKPWAGLG